MLHYIAMHYITLHHIIVLFCFAVAFAFAVDYTALCRIVFEFAFRVAFALRAIALHDITLHYIHPYIDVYIFIFI